ncbi:SCP-like protein [Ancylostoma ceylanicum]|uniref:SCP-like protein n=1 Tax=Ancylostoma ceylanicum TaxID=53326 RepID=A0A0D6LYY5_9BILA|nr:SCP-like protein [Ancylostoma ceylanicum]
MRFCTLAITFALVVALSLVEGMPVPNRLLAHSKSTPPLTSYFFIQFCGEVSRSRKPSQLHSWDCDLEHHAWSGVCDGTVDKNTYGVIEDTAGTDPIYMKAGNAQEICQCTNQGKDCIDYLCQIDYTPVGDIPTRVCTAKDGMNSDLETIATDMHNYYRRLVATGWAKDKKDGYAPTAKDMYALVGHKYTDCQAPDTIAEDTKAKVTGCPSTAPQADPGRSLNYYYVTKYNIPREQLLQEAISKWMKQLEDVGVGKTNIFDENAGVTYYANMVHDKVEKFACAVDVCDKTGNSAVICQYNALEHSFPKTCSIPTDGDPIYELGKPCKCTGGRQCSPLQGLCVVP